MRNNFGTAIALVVLFLGSAIGVVDGANLIANPGFESGTTPWIFYASGGGTFTTPSPGYEGNRSAQLVLSNGGTNIQLYQTGLALEANTRYRLSFAAYSNTGHDMTLRLLKHGTPYTLYMPDFTVNLATNWQTFSNEFTSSGFSGTVNDGRLMFWLPSYAVKGDNYYIDDVRLEKLPQGPIEINSCTRISSPGEYVLTQSITNSGVTSCINITSSDVIFDGGGYTVDGNGLTNYGLAVNNVNHITVKNLVVQDWNTRAVNIVNSNNNNFDNITVKSGNYDGFSLQNSNNNILRNIKALNTGNVGFVFENSYGNDLKDSIFQNNAWEDFDIYLTGGVSGCNNEVSNVSLTKYQLYYYNKSVTLKDIYAGAIYLCNADNSTVTNATVAANGQNSISNYYVENVTYTNITTSGLKEAIFFKYSANNTITSILMKDGWSGISYSTNTTNTNFKTATIYNMTDRAIRMYAGSSRNTISDSKIYNNSAGIYLNTAGKYGPNKIYNSVFNNKQNIEWGIADFFGDGSVFPNSWNTTKQTGTNIIGGPSLGGNFWGYPNGTGFSQTCTDADSDGICDSAYTLDSNNIDFLPLAYNVASGHVHNINKGTNYTTIQAAINDASPGNEIHVDSGTYYENIKVDRSVTLIGAGADATIVQAANANDHVFSVTVNSVNMTGFKITGATADQKAGIFLNSSSNNTLTGNKVSNNYYGIYLYGGSNNNNLIGNIVNSNGYGIYIISSSNNILNYNTVSSNGGVGIGLEDQAVGNDFNNNIVRSNGGDGISIRWMGSGGYFNNNTVSSNAGNGIDMLEGCAAFINNTISSNVGTGIFMYEGGAGYITNNNISSNGGDGIYDRSYGFESKYNNNIVNSNSGIGIYLSSPYGIKVTNNTLSMNAVAGIYVGYWGGNDIYNNFFNNSINVDFYEYRINNWNTTKTPGTNIIGGPNLGGNYWAHPSGTGFSQTCMDSDIDGICDSAYTLDSNNIDFLPLALSSIPSIRVVSPDGGENWTRGSTQMIRWNYTVSPGPNVRIELLKNGLLNSVLNSSTSIGSSGSGSYTWQINMTQTPDADYKVRINSTANSTYTDTSNTNFIISPGSDTSRPTVIGSTPTGINVPVNTQITVTFSEAMNQSSVRSNFSTNPHTTGSFSWSGNNITYIPGLNLTYNTTYSVKIGTGAKDLAGNNMSAPYEWQFTTISAATLDERVASLEIRVAALEAAISKLTNP